MTSTVSRRTFVRTAAVGAAVGGSGLASALIDWTPANAAETFVPNDPDLHLLRRATWGPTPSSVTSLHKMGWNKWLEQQLDPASIGDAYIDDVMAAKFPRLAWSISQAWTQLDGDYALMFETALASILRAGWSKRQLYEVMVDFWANHLNISNFGDNMWWSRHHYDRTVIRRHALGTFHDMLVASATHPAMMVYLNNYESTKYSPNENYGRELLELHTVGVNGGYDEVDMRNSALIMTGFGFDWSTGEFQYDKDDHYTGDVKVMHFKSTNVGAAKGYGMALDYLKYLSHHPSTAERIAYKLCTRFVSDTPPKALVNKLADIYLHHGTAITPVLHELFTSAPFKQSVGEKIRRPYQDMIATLRILGDKPESGDSQSGLQGLYYMVDGLSDAPLAWVPPNGYPDTSDAWRSAGSTLGRWNMHMTLAAHWWPNELTPDDPTKHLIPKPLPKTHGALIDALAKGLVFRKLTHQHRDAVLGFLNKSASDPLSKTDAAVTWRLPYVVALILDSPYHWIR